MNVVNDAPTLDLDANDSSGALGANYVRTFTEGLGSVRIADVDATLADIDSAEPRLAHRHDHQPPRRRGRGPDRQHRRHAPSPRPSSRARRAHPERRRHARELPDGAAHDPLREPLRRAQPRRSGSITFVASDGGSASNVGTATVTIAAVNDAPDRRHRRRPRYAATENVTARAARHRARRSPTSTRCRASIVTVQLASISGLLSASAGLDRRHHRRFGLAHADPHRHARADQRAARRRRRRNGHLSRRLRLARPDRLPRRSRSTTTARPAPAARYGAPTRPPSTSPRSTTRRSSRSPVSRVDARGHAARIQHRQRQPDLDHRRRRRAASPVEVTLNVSNGVLTLAGTAGLVFTAGDGTADASMTFTGTVAAINAALDGLVVRANRELQRSGVPLAQRRRPGQQRRRAGRSRRRLRHDHRRPRVNDAPAGTDDTLSMPPGHAYTLHGRRLRLHRPRRGRHAERRAHRHAVARRRVRRCTLSGRSRHRRPGCPRRRHHRRQPRLHARRPARPALRTRASPSAFSDSALRSTQPRTR